MMMAEVVPNKTLSLQFQGTGTKFLEASVQIAH